MVHNVPDELEKIILWCLNKDPEDRPTDINQLEQKLREVAMLYPWSKECALNWWSKNR